MQATDTMTIVILVIRWAEDAENKARGSIWQQIAQDIEPRKSHRAVHGDASNDGQVLFLMNLTSIGQSRRSRGY